MRSALSIGGALAGAMVSFATAAHESSLARPELILQQSVRAMPAGDTQDIRVLKATFQPGDRTVTHTHRFPVTVYVLEGAFTLELEGREPNVVKAGEAFVEPPHVTMTGFNRSASEPTLVVIFYVSDPGTPFLDPAQ
jgi:quercetin dioxygenase-like cupin family protein